MKWLGLALATSTSLVLTADAADPETPTDVATRVHAREPYPSELRIGDAPRWTRTHGPVSVRVHAGVPTGSTTQNGEPCPSGTQTADGTDAMWGPMLVPQEGGGRLGEEDDGWEGDPWAEPAPAMAPVIVDVVEAAPQTEALTPGAMSQPVDAPDGAPNPDAEANRETTRDPEKDPAEAETESESESESDPDPITATDPASESDSNESGSSSGGEPPLDEPPLDEPPLDEPPLDDAAIEPTSDDTDRDDDALWLLVLAALGFTGWLVRRFRQRHRTVRVSTPPSTPTISLPSLTPPSMTADIDYAAEITAMLRAGLITVGWSPHGRDLSFTSREVLRRLGRDDPKIPAMRELVRVAEIVRFAGVCADAALYERACAAYVAVRTAWREPPSGGETP